MNPIRFLANSCSVGKISAMKEGAKVVMAAQAAKASSVIFGSASVVAQTNIIAQTGVSASVTSAAIASVTAAEAPIVAATPIASTASSSFSLSGFSLPGFTSKLYSFWSSASVAPTTSIPLHFPSLPPIDPAFLALNNAGAGMAASAAVGAGTSAAAIAAGIVLPIGIAAGYGVWLGLEIRKITREQKLLSHTPETVYELGSLHREMLALTEGEGAGHNSTEEQSWWKTHGKRYALLLASLVAMYQLAPASKPVDEQALEKLIDFLVDPDAEKFGTGREFYYFHERGPRRTETHTGYYSKEMGIRPVMINGDHLKADLHHPYDLHSISAKFNNHSRAVNPIKPEQIDLTACHATKERDQRFCTEKHYDVPEEGLYLSIDYSLQYRQSLTSKPRPQIRHDWIQEFSELKKTVKQQGLLEDNVFGNFAHFINAKQIRDETTRITYKTGLTRKDWDARGYPQPCNPTWIFPTRDFLEVNAGKYGHYRCYEMRPSYNPKYDCKYSHLHCESLEVYTQIQKISGLHPKNIVEISKIDPMKMDRYAYMTQ